MTAVEVSIGFQHEDLWFYVSKLMRLRWLTLANGFKRAKPLHKILTFFLGLLILGVSAGSYLLTTFLLRQLDSPLMVDSGVNVGAFVDAIPTLVVSAVFLVILLTSFRLLLQALYLAKDMDFLMTAPVPIRAVFLTKFLEAVLPNFILVLMFGLPVLFGLGAASEFQILYFPLVLMVLACLSLFAAGIASLLVMAVVRIFPAKRVAEVLTFLGVVLFFVISQWSNLTGIKFESVSPEQVSQGSQILSRLNGAWSPLAWGGRGLVDLGEGRLLSGIFYLAITFVSSAGVFGLALNVAQRLYRTGWAGLQVSAGRKKTRHAADRRRMTGAGPIWRLIRYLMPGEVWAIMLKDFKQLWRDLSQISQVIGALIMGIVFAVMLLRSGEAPPVGKGSAPALFIDLTRTGLAYGSIVISMFVGWGLLTRLALVSFSMEGRSYWILKSAPVSARKLLWAKFMMAYLPSLTMGWIYLLGIALLQKVPFATILFGLPSLSLILAGLVGINLAFGVSGANLTWTDPRHMESGVGGCLGTIISIVYQFAALLLFFVPPLGLPLVGISERTGQLIGLLAGSAFALLCTILPLKLVKDRVDRIGEG